MYAGKGIFSLYSSVPAASVLTRYEMLNEGLFGAFNAFSSIVNTANRTRPHCDYVSEHS